jgi:hypothetical protein
MILRVPKDKSALLYQLLEGYEGMANYSTLDSVPGEGYRDIQLFIAPDFLAEMELVLKNIQELVPFIVLDSSS